MEFLIPEPVFLEYFHSTIQHPYDKIYCYVKTEA